MFVGRVLDGACRCRQADHLGLADDGPRQWADQRRSRRRRVSEPPSGTFRRQMAQDCGQSSERVGPYGPHRRVVGCSFAGSLTGVGTLWSRAPIEAQVAGAARTMRGCVLDSTPVWQSSSSSQPRSRPRPRPSRRVRRSIRTRRSSSRRRPLPRHAPRTWLTASSASRSPCRSTTSATRACPATQAPRRRSHSPSSATPGKDWPRVCW